MKNILSISLATALCGVGTGLAMHSEENEDKQPPQAIYGALETKEAQKENDAERAGRLAKIKIDAALEEAVDQISLFTKTRKDAFEKAQFIARCSGKNREEIGSDLLNQVIQVAIDTNRSFEIGVKKRIEALAAKRVEAAKTSGNDVHELKIEIEALLKEALGFITEAQSDVITAEANAKELIDNVWGTLENEMGRSMAGAKLHVKK